MSADILTIEDLKVHFPVRGGVFFNRAGSLVRAVDGVSIGLRQGEILGLVGESGCGKSTLARSIVRLAPVTSGRILFEGQDLAQLQGNALRTLRPRLQMIFQDPYASLDPRRTVYDTLAEPMLAHRIVTRAAASAEVAALMEKVGLARRFVRKYPHEFSGGQRQRIAIARALALRPRLILADEPVSALDVSVQAQILNLLKALCKEIDLTLVLISHDLAVVRHMAHRIAVMYLGRVVELGAADAVFDQPAHPYTRALLQAIPLPDPATERLRDKTLLQGEPPSPMAPPPGCHFAPRCRHAQPACTTGAPPLVSVRPHHATACRRVGEI